jgi:hypothetical protein
MVLERGEVDRLVRAPRRFSSGLRNDPSKFRAVAVGQRFVSHHSVCNPTNHAPQDSNVR